MAVFARDIRAYVAAVSLTALDIEHFQTVVGEQQNKRLQAVGADMLVIDRIELIFLQHVQQIMALRNKYTIAVKQLKQPAHDFAQWRHMGEHVGHGDDLRGPIVAADVARQRLR